MTTVNRAVRGRRFPLKLKFSLLLVGFVLAIGIVIGINFATSQDVAAGLAEVKDFSFPRFARSSTLVSRFEQISRLIEDAGVTGEESLLERGRLEKERFLQQIVHLLEVSPGAEEQARLIQLRSEFLRYFTAAEGLANSLLTSSTGDGGEELGSLALGEIETRSRLASSLKQKVAADLQQFENLQKSALEQSLNLTAEGAREQSNRAVLIGLLSSVLLLIVLTQMVRRIIVPISTLSQLTARVAKGNFDQDIIVPLLGHDEVGDLAHSFEAMTKGLQKTTVSKAYVDDIIKSMADTLMVVTPAGKIQTVNRATCELLGYGTEELLGVPADMICPDASELVELIGRAPLSVVRNVEKTYVARDGRRIPVSFSASVLLDPEERLQGIVCLAQDMTERKEAEQALHLANAQLAEARDAALQANATKSTFLANMSHELRTPLNAVIGYSEMLQEDAGDLGEESMVADLKKIQGAGKHLLGLINDILDISKIEAGKMQIFLEDFAISPMIEDVVSTVQPLVEKNSNRMVVECPSDIGTMHADMTRVRQVLFNLLSNAGKFTKEGVITLSVEKQMDHGTEWMLYKVRDTGIGLTPEQQSKLFQPFTQAEAGTTRKYGGTGLGLTISRHFCKMMAGDITLESVIGVGTTFIVKIPVVVPDEPQPQAAVVEERVERPRKPADGATVLVIDDDANSRELLRHFLGKEGFRVELASGGEDGIKMARQVHPAAITLDVMMPNMDGWQVLTALKAEPDLAKIPVIMITMVENQTLGYALGVSEYLRKPIDYNRLAGALRKHISHGQPSAG